MDSLSTNAPNNSERDLEIGDMPHPEEDHETGPKRTYKHATRTRHTLKEADTEPEYTIDFIWAQVQERYRSGQYNFERFESMQLLNLCLLQRELRNLAEEIYGDIGSKEDDYPEDQLRPKVARLKPMLKEYNEALISLHEIMSYHKAAVKTIGKYDRPKVKAVPLLMADLRGDLEPDGVRKLVEKYINKLPDSLLKADFFSVGPRRDLNAGIASGQYFNIRPYTFARAEEHEKEGMNRLIDNLARLTVAVFGGASLLVPMIIMIFSSSRNANLIITSTFVLFFALVLSLGSKASNQEILGATAGYAAVLVVFIGTSGLSN